MSGAEMHLLINYHNILISGASRSASLVSTFSMIAIFQGTQMLNPMPFQYQSNSVLNSKMSYEHFLTTMELTFTNKRVINCKFSICKYSIDDGDDVLAM